MGSLFCDMNHYTLLCGLFDFILGVMVSEVAIA